MELFSALQKEKYGLKINHRRKSPYKTYRLFFLK